jgi:hypothetical protein
LTVVAQAWHCDYVFVEIKRLESPNSRHFMSKLKYGGKDAQLPPMKRNVDSVVITVTI